MFASYLIAAVVVVVVVVVVVGSGGAAAAAALSEIAKWLCCFFFVICDSCGDNDCMVDYDVHNGNGDNHSDFEYGNMMVIMLLLHL